MAFNSIEDRALSEHRGSALLMKKSNGKYSILLPVEGTGENGSTPAQLDKTAIGNFQSTSVEGRAENPQKTIPFFLHRDNIKILDSIAGETHDFLRLLPDFTGFKYSGQVSYMANNTDVGSLEQGQITITPTSKDEYVENCYSLIEDNYITEEYFYQLNGIFIFFFLPLPNIPPVREFTKYSSDQPAMR